MGHPDLEAEILATDAGWGVPNELDEGLFGATIVRFYEAVQWFDGTGFADMLRTQSLYRSLDEDVREPLDAIAERIDPTWGTGYHGATSGCSVRVSASPDAFLG